MAQPTALQKAISHCRLDTGSSTIPNVVPLDYGIGIKFKDDEGIEYTTLPRRGKWGTTVRGRITSWVGISMDAIHFYGTLRVSEPSLSYTKDGKQHEANIGGYFDRHKPNEAKDIDIQVIRKLTQREMDDEPERWRGFRAGDNTTGWEDEEELIKVMKHIIKHRFKGWKYEIENSNGRTVK